MKHYCLHAILLASLALVACNKDKPSTPETPGTDPVTPTTPIPEADLQLEIDRTTKVLYYGDRKTEGVYNYFLGLGDMEFIKDNEGETLLRPADTSFSPTFTLQKARNLLKMQFFLTESTL